MEGLEDKVIFVLKFYNLVSVLPSPDVDIHVTKFSTKFLVSGEKIDTYNWLFEAGYQVL